MSARRSTRGARRQRLPSGDPNATPAPRRITLERPILNAKIGRWRLARQLQNAGVNADAIHGDKTQNERMKALEGFKAGTIEVLVATDVAARGLDGVELPVVNNHDVPFSPEDYVHRIGRTGRAGASGRTVMLMTGADERGFAGADRLTKQAFERRVYSGEGASRPRRRDSRDREGHNGDRERSGRERRPERPARAHADPRAPKADEFFSKLYESSAAEPVAALGDDASEDATRKRPARVAALLGDGKKWRTAGGGSAPAAGPYPADEHERLSLVKFVVFDEADRVLDMEFSPDISRILNLMPKGRRSLTCRRLFPWHQAPRRQHRSVRSQ